MTGTFAASVQFEGLTKRFGEKTAVDAISFDIPAGSMFGILGPNGAGKSTLIRMATGLLRPDAGKVRIEGIAVWEDPVTAKARIGVVPDDPTLFDRLSGRELIEFNGLLRRMDPPTIAHRRDELLRLVDLEDDADTLVADYSTGMRRKIAICCALLHNPRVIFLDEPFSGLDPVATETMERVLHRHTGSGGTVVFSSHVLDQVERVCDRLVIIDRGRVLLHGTMGEVTNGRRLQDVFVELVGGIITAQGDLEWLGSSSA
jgi:ABC-2 type transport system ATP-binding protein